MPSVPPTLSYLNVISVPFFTVSLYRRYIVPVYPISTGYLLQLRIIHKTYFTLISENIPWLHNGVGSLSCYSLLFFLSSGNTQGLPIHPDGWAIFRTITCISRCHYTDKDHIDRATSLEVSESHMELENNVDKRLVVWLILVTYWMTQVQSTCESEQQ